MGQEGVAKLRLYRDQYNPKGMTDENSLTNALLTKPDLISPVLTHLAGREDKRFPLSFLTEGMGRVKYVNDPVWEYNVIGRLDKAVAISVTQTVALGAAHARFTLPFAEEWFNEGYVLASPNGYLVRIVRKVGPGTQGYDYECEVVDPSSSATIPTTETASGQMWVQLFSPNALSGSRGNESSWVAPSKMTNQIQLIRKSYRYEGNAQNRVVNVEFNIGGKKSTLWWDFEEYQHMLKWKAECEYSLWYSEYNRDANGLIHNKDKNGNAIPLTSGIFDQIPNYDTYGSTLTASKLKATVRDVLYGAADSEQMNVVLFTGMGGLEAFDDAMKAEVAQGAYIKNTDPSSFMGGSGSTLQLGGFFTSYKHIDGHTITVRHLPLFDYGAKAENSPRHAGTGLPLESYKMVFLDMSMYDGEPNVYMVSRKGREMIRWAVAGATVPKGFSGNTLRASDVDGASVHFLKENGVCIRRATNSFVLDCTYSV